MLRILRFLFCSCSGLRCPSRMFWHRVQQGAALWVVLSLAMQSEGDVARQ